MGIEPTWPAWKAGVLPLNYTRVNEKYDTITEQKNQVFFSKKNNIIKKQWEMLLKPWNYRGLSLSLWSVLTAFRTAFYNCFAKELNVR